MLCMQRRQKHLSESSMLLKNPYKGRTCPPVVHKTFHFPAFCHYLCLWLIIIDLYCVLCLFAVVRYVCFFHQVRFWISWWSNTMYFFLFKSGFSFWFSAAGTVYRTFTEARASSSKTKQHQPDLLHMLLLLSLASPLLNIWCIEKHRQ